MFKPKNAETIAAGAFGGIIIVLVSGAL